MTIPIKERQRSISEGLRLAWKRRKANGKPAKPVARLSPKQLKKARPVPEIHRVHFGERRNNVMEGLKLELNEVAFDMAVHGVLNGKDENGLLILPSGNDLAIYVKPKATVNGKAMAVITFSVQLPDGSMAKAQYSTTSALLENAGLACKGWREGGHIK